jgi:hypothetical protein
MSFELPQRSHGFQGRHSVGGRRAKQEALGQEGNLHSLQRASQGEEWPATTAPGPRRRRGGEGAYFCCRCGLLCPRQAHIEARPVTLGSSVKREVGGNGRMESLAQTLDSDMSMAAPKALDELSRCSISRAAAASSLRNRAVTFSIRDDPTRGEPALRDGVTGR